MSLQPTLVKMLVVAVVFIGQLAVVWQASANEGEDALTLMRGAWEQGREQNKSVMVVMGAQWCDRCALLDRYMQDELLRERIESRYVVLNIDVSSPSVGIEVEADDAIEARLPAIVLVDSSDDFEQIIQSDQLITFLPEPYEPIFEWIENILIYADLTLAQFDSY